MAPHIVEAARAVKSLSGPNYRLQQNANVIVANNSLCVKLFKWRRYGLWTDMLRDCGTTRVTAFPELKETEMNAFVGLH